VGLLYGTIAGAGAYGAVVGIGARRELLAVLRTNPSEPPDHSEPPNVGANV
jgi:hypothetical protein